MWVGGLDWAHWLASLMHTQSTVAQQGSSASGAWLALSRCTLALPHLVSHPPALQPEFVFMVSGQVFQERINSSTQSFLRPRVETGTPSTPSCFNGQSRSQGWPRSMGEETDIPLDQELHRHVTRGTNSYHFCNLSFMWCHLIPFSLILRAVMCGQEKFSGTVSCHLFTAIGKQSLGVGKSSISSSHQDPWYLQKSTDLADINLNPSSFTYQLCHLCRILPLHLSVLLYNIGITVTMFKCPYKDRMYIRQCLAPPPSLCPAQT